MKYTFKYKGAEKTIEIPDEYIATQKRTLGLSNKEAIDLYLFDEGYVESEFVHEMTERAKKNKAQSVGHSKRKAPKRKEDPIKRAMIAFLLDSLVDAPQAYNLNLNVECPTVVNPERIISFTIGEDKYELTLSKKRK